MKDMQLFRKVRPHTGLIIPRWGPRKAAQIQRLIDQGLIDWDIPGKPHPRARVLCNRDLVGIGVWLYIHNHRMLLTLTDKGHGVYNKFVRNGK